MSAPRRPRKPLSACGPDYARREDAERHKRVINGTAIALACQWPGVTGHGWHVVSIREIEADIGRRRARIKPVSDKRRAENAGRRKMIALLWPDGTPKCAVPWCHRLADDVHEPLTRGRGGSITDPANATVLCRRHHDYITFTPESELAPWVYGLGFLVHSWPAGRSAKGQS